MKLKITSKLFITYLLIVFITIGVTSGLLTPLLKKHLVLSKQEQLLRKANVIAQTTEQYLNKEMDDYTYQKFLNVIDQVIESRILIIDKNGYILAASFKMPDRRDDKIKDYFRKGARLEDENIKKALSGETVIIEEFNPHFHSTQLSIATPVKIYDNKGGFSVEGIVLTFSPVFLVRELADRSYYYIFFSSIIAVLSATLAAFYISKKVSLPLKKMNKAALDMAKGDYDTRIDVTSSDEVGDLAISFNYLSGKLAENIKELKGEKGKLELIVQSIGEGIIAVDSNNKVILINPVAERLLNIKNKDSLGIDINTIMPEEDMLQLFSCVLDKGDTQVGTFAIADRIVKLTNTAIFDDNNKVFGVVSVIQDISEMERVEQLRRDFVANVSHELRTPITVIRGYINCLIDGVYDKKRTADYYYSIICDETMRLERLIKDLMDLSRLQSGNDDLLMEEVDIPSLIQSIIEKMRYKSLEKDIQLYMDAAEQDLTAICDGDRITQLLIILIDNAIKFTSQNGEICVKVYNESEKVRIDVADNGIGIPEEELPYIFDRFYIVEKSRTRQKDGGTGLGLSIAQMIAQIHDTDILVSSNLGEGTVFSFYLGSCTVNDI